MLNQSIYKNQTKLPAKEKIFKSFKILNLIEKQVYEVELQKDWKINNIIHIWLLKQDIVKKKWQNKETFFLKLKKNHETNSNV